MNKLKTPVLFIIFNRPDMTKQVFEKIRLARPVKLYVACDGPRDINNNEKEKVILAREIATRIDWPCELKTLFSTNNLGCKKGCITAIDWFFKNEEKGIILEDDCLPHLDFFYFCENLLEYYDKDERIFSITGNNFQNNKWRGKASYYFSKYANIWGWATWKRTWKYYQVDISFWPEWRKSRNWLNFFPSKVERFYWEKIFKLVYEGKIDTWDYSLQACNFYLGGLTATPNVNLVSNIGFRDDATHTKFSKSKFSKIPVYELKYLTHPKKVEVDLKADQFIFKDQNKYKNFIFTYYLISFFKKILFLFLKR
ncbi:MAG: glycosyltransferase family 2 protein [Flavobacteriia bacterium]|nr:glycosyltransferase family 2 protein [Flavobacteriia bacterium]